MKKNLFKKLATIVITTAIAVSTIVALPMKAKAATIKEIYLVEETEAQYSLGFWQGSSGIMIDAQAAADGWTYLFEEVQDGVYKLSLSVTDDYTTVGLSISVDGVELYKADANWSGEAGASAWTSFTDAFSAMDKIYIGLDKENNTISIVSAPEGLGDGEDSSEDVADETEETTTKKTEDTKETDATVENTTTGSISNTTTSTAKSSSGMDTTTIMIIAAVGIVIVVAIILTILIAASSKKKSIDDFDDDDF